MNQRRLPSFRHHRRMRAMRRRPRYNEHKAAHLRHVSNEVERCRNNLSERVFAEEWIKACRWYSSGGGILELLIPWPVTQREATVAATVVQWLGTTCGTGFITKCLNRIGEDVVQKESAHDFGRNSYYYSSEITPTERLPGAWQLFARQKSYAGNLRERTAQMRVDMAYPCLPVRPVKTDELHKRISKRKPGEFQNRLAEKRLEAVRKRLKIAEPELKVLL